MCLYLSYHLEQTSAAAHLLRDRVMELLELLDRDVGAVQLRDVVDVKNTLMRVSAVAEEQNQCIMRLAEADASNDSFHFVKGSVNVLVSLAGSTERMVDRLEARMVDIRSGYDAHQQDRIRHRLNLLTMMSAVFLPLTLMAGIWGMSKLTKVV
jgi:magnesium transporter